MALNKWITALLACLLVLNWQSSNAQCTFTHFTLLPSTPVCGTSADITMSGSDNSNYIYQLMVNGSNVGPTHHGTTGSIDFGSITTGGTVVVSATIFGSNCPAQVVAGTSISFANAVPTGGSISSAGGATLLCPGNSIMLTFTPPDNQTYNYQWNHNNVALTGLNATGTISGGTSVTYPATLAGPYTMTLNNPCGFGNPVAGPTLTTAVAPGTPGPVTGPTNLQTESNSAAYSITPSTNTTGYTWSLSNNSVGTISPVGPGSTFTWNAGFSGTVTINAAATGNCNTSTSATGLVVTVYPALVPAAITSGNPTINYGTSPQLTANAASGANGVYTYQWQSSTTGAGGSFSNLSPVLTAPNYTAPAITSTTYYQLVSFSNGVSKISSSSVTVSVYQPLALGYLNETGNSTVNYGSGPTAAITCPAATGGAGGYNYKWQSSAGLNGPWADVSPAQTALSYQPTGLTATIYYRVVVTTVNGESANSGNVLGITVLLPLVGGSINPSTQTINYNTTATLSSTGITGGDGTYAYQWKSSPDHITWTPIPLNATLSNYTTVPLTAPTTYYQLYVTSYGVTNPGLMATVNVYPPLVPGLITAGNQSINYNTIPQTVITSAPATGGAGAGSYTYQWQISTDNINFTDIANANLVSYTVPAALTATTYYHLIAWSNLAKVIGLPATVTVYAQLVPGPITAGIQSINYNTVPPLVIKSGAAQGGNGTITYQWQNSLDNSTFTDIGTNANTVNYTVPGALTATTYYHLIAKSNGVNIPGPTATVTVYPPLASGALNSGTQSINYNTIPAPIIVAVATGGNGTYGYQWQSSPTGFAGSFLNVTGGSVTITTKTINYQPPALTSTTYYQLVSTSNTVSVPSSMATVTVLPGSCAQFNAPTPIQNYVVTNTTRTAGFTNENQLAGQGRCTLQQAIQYVDGLGRPIQSIQVMGSPLGNDVVIPQTYDQYGREVNKYLPYTPVTGTQGSYRPNAISTDQSAFYNAPPTGVVQIPTTGQVAYAATRYEASPLERPQEQGAPGLSSQLGGGHTATTAYSVNTSTDAVKKWLVNATGGASYAATYSAGTLYKTTVMDENQNNNAVIQFKDLDGRIVSRKVQSGATTYLVTDYVYDDQGNLRYVIPPLPTASGSNPAVAMPTTFAETTTVFLNYFYGYRYDGLKRQVAKKIPGKGWQYVVYNTMDQPILTRDTNQSAKGIWMAVKYDALGRVVMTGEYASTATQSTLQATADGITTNLYEAFTNAATNYGYTHQSNPDISTGTGNKVLTANYYDNYNVISNTAVNPGSSVFSAPSAAVDSLDKLPRSLLVATLVNVLGSTSYLFTVSQYDKYGRAVKVINQNFVNESPAYNKYDTEDNQYSFQSLPTQSIRNHYLPASASPQLTINSWNLYDNMNRPLLSKQQYISQANTGAVVTLSKMDYNELGQPLTKHLHSTSTVANPANSAFLQHIDYRYNARGWLTKINDLTNLYDQTYTSTPDVFSEQLDYDQLSNGYTGTAQYNGNISTLRWQTYQPAGITLAQEQKGYIFTYDNLNRLTASVSKAATTGDTQYNETMTYDELGNIITLVRKNGVSTTLNNMTYNYVGFGARSNKLWNTTDAGTEGITSSYHYDANGSLTDDSHKTVTAITYNEINLPQSVTLTNNTETLTYNYDATGKKLERIIKWGTTINEDRFYDDGIEYSGSTSPSIELVHTPEGRALPSAGAYTFQYAITDHLGNTRALFSDLNNDGVLTANEILQATDYYAFGRSILYSQNITPGPDNKYKYNGKEYQADLSEYDYGARFYDPVIARWTTIDPLAETSRRWSPYNYVENNPVKFTDPDGDSVKYDATGNTTYTGADAQNVARGLKANEKKNGIEDKSDKSWSEQQKDDIKNAPHLKPLEHWWQRALASFQGGRDYNGVNYDNDGNPVGKSYSKIEFPFYVTGPGEVVKLWGFWSDYEKVTVDGTEYAKIGERLFTQHAVERMAPSGLGQAAGGVVGRSVPPSVIEDVISRGATTTFYKNGILRTQHTLGTVRVITEQAGKIVITVIH